MKGSFLPSESAFMSFNVDLFCSRRNKNRYPADILYLYVFISHEQLTGGGDCIYGNSLVPSCHGGEEDGCHEQGDHLTSAAPQLRGVKMPLKPSRNLT